MIIDKLFTLMAEKKASDIYVTVGAPIHIKIDGNTLPINQQAMDAAMIHRMAYEMMTPEQIARFEGDREMNLSFSRRNMGNFRVNIFWQRNSIAIVVRYILDQIPRLDALGLPPVLSDVIMEKRGLVLVVGATGSGKSTTIASMLDHRNENFSGHILTIEDPIEYLHPHKLCTYLFTLAGAFTTFYEQCPVLKSEGEVRTSRLAICAATRTVLGKGLDLLGIVAPDRM